jgi:hypothetical protein
MFTPVFTPDLKPRRLYDHIYSSDSVTGEDLVEFAEKLQSAIAEHGAEQVTLSTDYENSEFELCVTRFETPVECIERVELEEKNHLRQIESRRKLYADLRREFGDESKS